MGTVTITDVAREAGVSIKSVSRVLNNERHVREALRARVLAAVKALDYKPNPSARALAGSRSYLIALYVNDASTAYAGQLASGALKACRNLGYHLMIEQLSAPEFRALQDSVRVDGIILTPPLCDDRELLEVLEAKGAPVVRIAPAPDPRRELAGSVYIDDWQAGYDMTAYLQGLGHRKIAFIAGLASHAAAAQRCEGYRAAMDAAGMAIQPDWIQDGDLTFRSGVDAGERLIAGSNRPTAIFAGTDDMALGVMAVAHRWRLEVPDDLSIVGFDDSPGAQVVRPQLTTVRQPVAEMASVAAEMLIKARPGDEAAEPSRRLDFELVIR
ncbi:MAG: LacI family DNA-binding transcriptional regulator, partial [Phenylobacterium sp.]